MFSKKRKIIIMVFIVIVVILLLFLFYGKKRKKEKNDINTEEKEIVIDTINNPIPEDISPWADDSEIPKEELKFVKMTDRYSYFLMKQCIKNFYTSQENALNLIDVEAKQNLNINENNIKAIYRRY